MTNPTAMAAVEKLMVEGYFATRLTPERVIDKVSLMPTKYGREMLDRGVSAINSICLVHFIDSYNPESFFTVLNRSFFSNELELSITGDEFMGLFAFVYGI